MRDLQAARRASLTLSVSSSVGPAGSEQPPSASTSPRRSPTERRRLRRLCVVLAVAGLVLDVVTKVVVVARIDPQQPVRLLGGLLTLRLIRNPGAAFSQGEGFTWVFAVAAAVVLVFVLVRLVPRLGHRGWAVALGLLCAGVAGNLVDRVFRAPAPMRGHVVDFLQLPYWPIFNVADMCITTAAVMIVVLSMVRGTGVDGERPARPGARPDARPDGPGGQVDDGATSGA